MSNEGIDAILCFGFSGTQIPRAAKIMNVVFAISLFAKEKKNILKENHAHDPFVVVGSTPALRPACMDNYVPVTQREERIRGRIGR